MITIDPPVLVPRAETPHTIAGLPLAAWTRAIRPSTIQEMLGLMGRPGVISFALGLPAPELFPVDEYARAADRVLFGDLDALQYRPASREIKEHIAGLMASRGVTVRPEQVFLTTAAQQALSLLARVLLPPGGTVICDELVYMGFQQVVEPYAPRMLTVTSSLESGMDVDAVRAHLESGERPAFIYCVTDGHNPLGCSVSPEGRRALVELAREFRVPIVEDDAYGLLHFGNPELPLRALDDEWVLYVGSFSKVLAPGFRVGWIIAPEALVPVLGCAKDGADLDSGTFSQRLVSKYLDSGHFPRHLATIRAAYQRRRDVMIEEIRRHFPAGTRYSTPRNGALVWVELPRALDAAALLRPALEAGVAFVPGSAFAVPGSTAGRNCMRLNFSYPSADNIREGIARLGQVIRNAA
ncbi:MAG TPA: PLP-dependent aminotransferase family protein [Longimicrobium sp.]|jgi:2-aminoadipate transaminase|uniref:aminotransferase-like domain-containing protein n=1 Tax=Longimicrobium sp. TaxID=2029185 RepID=UPI002EDA3BB1